jgi:hypothetical protein
MPEVIYFLPVLLGIALLVIGIQYKDYLTGVMGGFVLFAEGVSILISPISGLTTLQNLFIGNSLWAVGAYVWIRSGIDVIKGRY